MEETLGKRIVQHRKRLGLTQDQLAEKLGVTAQAVSKWENDQSCPDISTLPRLAALFGTTTDALLGCALEAEIVSTDEEPEKSGWEFHWDTGRHGSVCLAIFVLLVGGLMVAARSAHWDVGFWDIAWPSALLVFGLSSLPRRFHFTNAVCALLGGYFLVKNLGFLKFTFNEDLIFPVIVVVFGLSLLVDALGKPKKGHFHIHKKGDLPHNIKKQFAQENESFTCSVSFGEVTHRITLDRVNQGRANVCFGEMEVDLTTAGEIADGCRLDMNAHFGSLTLKLPKAYRVECAAGTSFGEISIHGHPDEQSKGTVMLSGGIHFGNLEIHYI